MTHLNDLKLEPGLVLPQLIDHINSETVQDEIESILSKIACQLECSGQVNVIKMSAHIESDFMCCIYRFQAILNFEQEAWVQISDIGTDLALAHEGAYLAYFIQARCYNAVKAFKDLAVANRERQESMIS
jgi:hypothetical protein